MGEGIVVGDGVCSHENRLLVLKGGWDGNGYDNNNIRYSNVADTSAGYKDNYVNVGSSDEKIIYAYEGRGGLNVVKRHSIWLKSTIYEDGITSPQFSPVVQNIPYIYEARVFDGELFLITKRGLFHYASGNLLNLSTPVHGEWDFSHSWRMGYRCDLKHILCSDSTAGIVYIYDLLNKRWTAENFTACSFCSYDDGVIYLDGTNQPKQITSATGSGVGEIWFPFTDMDNPHETKYLNRIHINYTGTIRIRVYVRSMAGTAAATLYDSNDSGANQINNGILEFTPNTPFREISVRITTDSSGAVVKSVAVEYDERRA